MSGDLVLAPEGASNDDAPWGSPSRTMLVIGLAVVAGEFLIMTVILPLLPHMGTVGEGIADTVLLSLMVAPTLYLFLFRPLQNRLAAERAAKIELGSVGERLRQSVRELEDKSREADILNEMDDLLQTSRTFDEAYRIFKGTGERLLPGGAGGVLVMANSRNVSELVANWGNALPLCAPERCNPDDCWALRKGQMHLVGGKDGLSIPCAWATGEKDGVYACVPLVAQGQALGVTYFNNGRQPMDARQIATCTTLSRHIALALANLKLNETLHRQSVCDPLTGLFNRRYLQLTLDREVHRAKRRGGALSVIMMDVDHFKRFNDDFGHEVGDIVLQEIADLLRRSSRAEDIACRYGGEEFILVMPEAPAASAFERAEEIRLNAERLKIVHHGATLRSVTISQGVASYPEHGGLIDSVLKAADAALYESKAAGRNRVTLAKSKNGSALDACSVVAVSAVQ